LDIDKVITENINKTFFDDEYAMSEAYRLEEEFKVEHKKLTKTDDA
jgi:hypothetical protein